MKTTLNIPDKLVKEVMLISHIHTKTKAVIEGLKELKRQKMIEKIVSKAGTLNFSDKWEKTRHER